MRKPAMKLLWPVGLFILCASVAGCGGRHRATSADCGAVLRRLTDLELAESGFHDPRLRIRWEDEVARKLASEMGSCTGRQIPDDLHACLENARTVGGIAHGCLR
jgi:hypothetical protein